MARNEEKAQAMLNRWIKQKQELHQSERKPIPRTKQGIFKIQSINECEKFRNSLTRDIVKKVGKIQNAGLGEKIIRELNDEINRLLTQVRYLEERITSLGGANYKKVINNELSKLEGSELPGFGVYKYFGAAKDLPGVRDLFKKEIPEAPAKPLIEIFKNIDLDFYYARKIDNLDQMLEEEKRVEEELHEEELWTWASQRAEVINKKLGGQSNPTKEQILQLMDEEADYELNLEAQREKEQKEIEEQESLRIQKLNEKKKQLLEEYLKD